MQWALRALSLGVKRSGLEADGSTTTGAEIKSTTWIYTFTPSYVFMTVLN
jgi:hypothetical protein